jgi:hypothetical protein
MSHVLTPSPPAGNGPGVRVGKEVEQLASCAVKLKYVTKILEEVDGI